MKQIQLWRQMRKAFKAVGVQGVRVSRVEDRFGISLRPAALRPQRPRSKVPSLRGPRPTNSRRSSSTLRNKQHAKKKPKPQPSGGASEPASGQSSASGEPEPIAADAAGAAPGDYSFREFLGRRRCFEVTRRLFPVPASRPAASSSRSARSKKSLPNRSSASARERWMKRSV